MSNVDVVRESIIGACEQAYQVLDSIESNAPALIRKAAELIVWRAGIPPVLDEIAKDQIVKLFTAILDDFLGFARDAVGKIKLVTDFMGSPDSLRAASAALSAIGTDAETLAREVSPQTLLGTDPVNWSGWNRYDAAIATQPDEVAIIATVTTTMSTALDEMANTIEDFYLSVAGVVLGSAGAAIGLGVAIAGIAVCFTGVGAPVGLPTAIAGGIAALIGIAAAILSAYQLAVQVSRDINDQIGSLEGAMQDGAGAITWLQPVGI
jgi:hypothetical protein